MPLEAAAVARTPVTPDPGPVDPAPVVEIPTVVVLPPEAGVPGRYEFTYPYPVLLADLGREVETGDVLDWPAGPPNTSQWRSTDAPITSPREG